MTLNTFFLVFSAAVEYKCLFWNAFIIHIFIKNTIPARHLKNNICYTVFHFVDFVDFGAFVLFSSRRENLFASS